MSVKNYVRLFSYLLLVVLFASCTQSSVYEMIPADAQFALKIDMKSIFEKSLGGENKDSKIVLNELKESCDDFESDDLAKIVRGIIDDPRMSGINLTAPAVISGKLDLEDEEVELYMALSLGDSKKFMEFVEALYEEAKEYCGTYYGGPSQFTLEDNAEGFYFGEFLDEDLCLGVTSDFAVFYCSTEGLGEKLKVGKRALRDLFSQESKCEAAGIDAFEKMSGDVSLWMNGGELTRDALKTFKYDLDFLYKHLIAHSEWYEGSYYLMNLSFEKGKNIYEMTIGGSKELMAEFSKYSSASSSKYFKYLPKDALAAVNFKLNQDLLVDSWEALSSLSELEEVKEVLELEYDINEKTIKGFPGIITAAVSASSISEESPSFMVVAECDKKVYDILVDILEEELEFEKEGSAYVYETWTSAYYITYADGAIMFMDDKIWQRSKGKALKESFSSNSLSSDIAKGGVLFDLSSLSEEDLEDLAEDEFDMDAQDLLQIMSSAIVTYDKSSAKFVWNMGDKESNLFQILVALIAENI